MMDAGELAPMIIVMPEGGRGYWADGLNTADDRQWSEYVLDDLVPYIDANYRTMAEPGSRAIGGLLRGGFGALYLALTHPEVFSIVGAHSPSLPDYAGLESPRIGESGFANFDPITLAATLDPTAAPQIRLDIGTADDWRPAVETLDGELTAQGIAHILAEDEGGHLQEYWMPHIPGYLKYYASAFARSAVSRPVARNGG
jgi:enterochelin esterase-like enzyme